MRWADCRSEAEKREAVQSALRVEPSVTAAAKALGVNRQYLYELLPRYGPPDTTDRPDGSEGTDSVGPVGSTDTVGPEGRESLRGGVSPTRVGSLTYGRRRRRLSNMASATTAMTETVRTAVDLPKSWLDWLEQEALRRKQAGLQPRLAKSPVIVEALEVLRERLEAKNPKTARRERTEGEGGEE